jgi:hypothetical protein
LEVVLDYADPPGGKVGEVASRVFANPKLQLEQDLRNLKAIVEGRATPEEIQRQPAATTVQSGVAAFVTSGAGPLFLGAGVVLLLLMRRRSGGSVAPPGGKRRVILKL